MIVTACHANALHWRLDNESLLIMPRLSSLAQNLSAESAFTVLAIARALKAKGKDVVELEIGDSPFPSTPHAKRAGIRAIEENETGYCASLGLPEFRAAAARFVSAEFGYSGDGRKRRGRLGCQAFRAVLRRGGARPGRRGAWSSALSFRLMCPISSAAVRGPCWCR